MRTAFKVAPGSTIFLLFLLAMPFLALGGDKPAYPPVSSPAGAEICFPLSDGERLLRVVESFAACQEVVRAGEEALASSDARASVLEARVLEQDRELTGARKVIEDTRKVGEEAAKAAAPKWYQRVLNAGKWVGLGILVGFVAGAGK